MTERELAGEVLRLREALEAVTKVPKRDGIFRCWEIARAALKHDPLNPRPSPEVVAVSLSAIAGERPEPSLGDPVYYAKARRYLDGFWGGRCAYCQRGDGPLEIDHVRPVSRGGSDRTENLTLACRVCNKQKGTATADEFGYPGVTIQACAAKGIR